MASELRLRRGTSVEHDSFTGANAEVTVNTTNKSIHVHDGTTTGGYEVARVDLNNVSNSTFAAKASAAGISGGGGSVVATITAATQADPVVITTSASHGFVDGTEVGITDVVGMTQLNGNNYYADVLSSTTFALYSDVDLSTSVNGTGFTAYSSGGEASGTASGGAPIDAPYLTVSSDSSLPNERRLQGGNGISLDDGGAGGGLSVAVDFSDDAPRNLGAAASGVSTDASRADHVHAMPTSTDIGAVPTARQVIAGSGLTGGGALTADVTLSLSAGANSLSDVYVNNPANGDVLIYNDATSQFENSQNFAKNTVLKDNVVVATSTINKFNFVGSGITATVNGGDSNRIDVNFSNILTEESVQDIIGDMVADNTESGISVTYNDTSGKVNFAVNNPVLTLSGAVAGSATMTNLGNTTITTTISNDSVELGTKTTGNYVASITEGTGISVTNGAGGLEGAVQTIAIDLQGKESLAEFVSDTVGTMFTGNTESGISLVYVDSDNTIDVDVDDFTITLAGDLSGSATITNLANATLTASIAANSVALGTDTTGSYVQSLVQGTGVSITNNSGEGATPTIAIDLQGKESLAEFVSDTVGTMIGSNTESGINVTYNDSDNTIDFDVDDFTITLAGDLSGSATITNLGNATLTAAVTSNAVALGTNTTGNYVANLVEGTGINITNNSGEGATPTIAIDTSETAFVAGVQDIVGGMVGGNTESGIRVQYQASDGTLDFDVSDPTITLSGDVSGSATMTNLGSVNIAVTVSDDSHNHTIENIDGLRAELDGLLSSGDGLSFGSDITTRNILPATNNLYNIGSSTSNQYLAVYAQTFEGVSTSAKYADLAERYHADSNYPIGTIVKIGGTKEVTATTEENDTQVMGVVSENPAYLMNAGAGENDTHPAIAMTGRVRVKVEGAVQKGQRIVSSNTPGVGKAVDDNSISSVLSVVGRALESNSDVNIKMVECVIGKL